MYTPFQNLTDQASIWIYQADRQLDAATIQAILDRAKPFLDTWTSHGRPLLAGAEIRHTYFLILGIEKADFELSCCTTDSAIQFLHGLKEAMGIDFLDRKKVVIQSSNQYTAIPIQEIKEKLKTKSIPSDAYTFNNIINQKGDLATKWLIPVHQAWFAR